MYTIEEQIWHKAKENPEKVAIKNGKKCVTYGELIDRIFAAKCSFEQLPKYVRGAHIILVAAKNIEFVYAYFGAHLAGLITVPIDSETNQTRLNYIINITNPIYLIGFDKITTSIDKLSLTEFIKVEDVGLIPKIDFPTIESVSDVMFTTGTTGLPKGVPLTFGNAAAAARNINEYIGNTNEDNELLALPISHSFGLGRLRCCLSNGQTLYLLGSFVNVKRLFRIMKEESISGFSMVPASWKYLQKMSGDELGTAGENLRYIEMGSAYLSPGDKEYLARLLPKTRIYMHYGLTEASRSAFLEFNADKDHLDSVGKASPNTQIAIFDRNGNNVGYNTEGEICIAGDHVMTSYLNADNSEIFHGQYFRTGDCGEIDNDGYIKLTARFKELINVGGKKVSPNEVETEILKIPGVIDCACIGIKDPNDVLGEVVKSYIVSDNINLTPEQINRYLTDKLESYKIPAIYEWTSQIPRTSNGKILRSELRND